MNRAMIQPMSPVSRVFIALTLCVACGTPILVPLPIAWTGYLPDLVSLTLLYWCIQRPDKVSFGTVFIVGIGWDILTQSPFGLHAFVYVMMLYGVLLLRPNYIMMNGFAFQALMVGVLLLFNFSMVTIIRWFFEGVFVMNAAGFFSLSLSALLWPLLNKIMLTAYHKYHP